MVKLNYKIKTDKKEMIMRYSSPFKSLVFFCVPTIIIMLAFSIYNLCDKIVIQEFGPQSLLENATFIQLWKNLHGGIAPTFNDIPDIKQYINLATQYSYVIFYLGSSFCLLIGVGIGVLYSISYGKRDFNEMGQVYANGIIYTFIFSILIGFCLFFLSSPNYGSILIKIQQGSESNEITTYLSWRYVEIFIFFLPVMFVNYLISSVLRSQGKTLFLIILTFSSLVLNLALDFLLIVALKQDMNGAILATSLSWIFNIIVSLIIIYTDKNINLKIKWEHFRLRWFILKDAFLLGLTAFFIKSSDAIFSLLNSFFIAKLHGSPYDATNHIYILQELYSSLMPWLVIITNVMAGISQGARIVMAYSFGAKKFRRIHKILILVFYALLIWLITCWIILAAAGPQLAMIFAFPREQAFNSDYPSRFYIIANIFSYPLFAFTFSVITLFTSIKLAIKSAFLSLFRSFISIFILAVIGFYLSNWFYDTISQKYPGLIYFFFCGMRDFVTVFFALAMGIIFWKKNKKNMTDPNENIEYDKMIIEKNELKTDILNKEKDLNIKKKVNKNKENIKK